MKLLKLMTGSILVLALVGTAQAATTMRLTGSTAFRSNTHTAIQNIFDAGTVTFAYLDNAGGTATISNTSAAIFKGNIAGVATTIKTHWSGSEAGIQTVAGSPNFTVSYFDDTTATLPPPGNKLPNGTALTDSSVPDVAMSDTFQSSSLFHGTVNGVTYQQLNKTKKTAGLPAGQVVGVVQFEFVASNSAPGDFTNMTSQNARDLWSNGHVALSLFTGAAGDEGFTVYATGRDIDSGTRLTALAETGLGALATVKQYEPEKGGVRATTCCGALDAPPYSLEPGMVINGITEPIGDGGYSSGGDLSNGISNTTSGSTCFATYLGLSDAGTAITNGAHALTYNGSSYSVAAVQEGQYTFWGYEHLYYRDTTLATVKTVADKLALQIFNTDAPVPHYNDMKVSRKTDGGIITQNF
ncbi:MAG TPA: hypothetical protein VGI60_10490 [Chthoniobacterales bacterium]|jgi:hypothetical protein